MFTGIVAAVGTVVSCEKNGSGLQLVVDAGTLARRFEMGASVCVSGVCLTVTSIQEEQVAFDVMEETVQKTTVGRLRAGDLVNLEPSLRAGDALGGHLVYGHVDGIGIVQEAGERLKIAASKDICSLLAPKGSVAIDGVSLTMIDARDDWFSVGLIPYTKEHTTLGKKHPGDSVNIEVDMLARYVRTAIQNKSV